MQNNPVNPDAARPEPATPDTRKSRLWGTLLVFSTLIMAISLTILIYTVTRKKSEPKPEVLDKKNVTREEAGKILVGFDLPPLPESAKTIRILFIRHVGGQVYIKCALSAEDGAAYIKDASKELAIPFDKSAMRKLHSEELLDWWTPNRIKNGLMHERTWQNKNKKMREGLYIYWDAQNNILYLHRSWS